MGATGAAGFSGEHSPFSAEGSAAALSSGFAPAPNGSPPLDEPALWWLKTPEGKSYGPVGKAELDRWVGEGRVTSDCALRHGDGTWEPADRQYSDLREPARSEITYLGARGVSAGPAPQPSYYGAQQYGASNPYASSTTYAAPASPQYAYGRRAGQQPHRGMTILMLALVGWVVGCPVLGIVAWVMASADLREIRSGRMDPEGLGLTQAGQILGAIHSIMLIAGMVLMFLFVFASAAFGAL
jgi:hypothetical protein